MTTLDSLGPVDPLEVYLDRLSPPVNSFSVQFEGSECLFDFSPPSPRYFPSSVSLLPSSPSFFFLHCWALESYCLIPPAFPGRRLSGPPTDRPTSFLNQTSHDSPVRLIITRDDTTVPCRLSLSRWPPHAGGSTSRPYFGVSSCASACSCIPSRRPVRPDHCSLEPLNRIPTAIP